MCVAGNGPEESYCTIVNIIYLLMFGLKGWTVLGVGFYRHTPQQKHQQQFEELVLSNLKHWDLVKSPRNHSHVLESALKNPSQLEQLHKRIL